METAYGPKGGPGFISVKNEAPTSVGSCLKTELARSHLLSALAGAWHRLGEVPLTHRLKPSPRGPKQCALRPPSLGLPLGFLLGGWRSELYPASLYCCGTPARCSRAKNVHDPVTQSLTLWGHR